MGIKKPVLFGEQLRLIVNEKQYFSKDGTSTLLLSTGMDMHGAKAEDLVALTADVGAIVKVADLGSHCPSRAADDGRRLPFPISLSLMLAVLLRTDIVSCEEVDRFLIDGHVFITRSPFRHAGQRTSRTSTTGCFAVHKFVSI